MKKIILFLCTALFLLGIAMNLQYAVNDYDFKTNSIHSVILANETGTGTGTGTADPKLACLLIFKKGCDVAEKVIPGSLYDHESWWWDEQGYSYTSRYCGDCDEAYIVYKGWGCC